MPMHTVFNYGMQKESFSNYNKMLQVVKCLGTYCTVNYYPLVIAGKRYSPDMFP